LSEDRIEKLGVIGMSWHISRYDDQNNTEVAI
jgi:hypothetical protein